jgi:ABC-type branched-subunit amino acid transport system ATPase component
MTITFSFLLLEDSPDRGLSPSLVRSIRRRVETLAAPRALAADLNVSERERR